MIDPDRDYLLSTIIDLNATLIEYKNAYEAELQKTSRLTEANGQALANAEGWKKKFHEACNEVGNGWKHYYDLLTAARRDSGWKNKRSYLRHLGLPEA